MADSMLNAGPKAGSILNVTQSPLVHCNIGMLARQFLVLNLKSLRACVPLLYLFGLEIAGWFSLGVPFLQIRRHLLRRENVVLMRLSKVGIDLACPMIGCRGRPVVRPPTVRLPLCRILPSRQEYPCFRLQNRNSEAGMALRLPEWEARSSLLANFP
jgi:hypothetical protein